MINSDRKAKRIERIRGEIMDAAVEIIGRKGFKNTTTREIAEEADMAEGTLYNYFKNKDDILMSIAERYVAGRRNLDVSTDVSTMEEFIIHLNTRLNRQTDPEHQNERRVLKALLPEFLTDKALGKLYFERIVQPYLETLEEKLTILKDRGIARDLDVQSMARLFYASLIGFAVLELNNDPVVIERGDEFRKTAGEVYVEVLSKGMGPRG